MGPLGAQRGWKLGELSNLDQMLDSERLSNLEQMLDLERLSNLEQMSKSGWLSKSGWQLRSVSNECVATWADFKSLYEPGSALRGPRNLKNGTWAIFLVQHVGNGLVIMTPENCRF